MIGTNRNPRTALTTATSTRSESLTGKRYFAPVGTAAGHDALGRALDDFGDRWRRGVQALVEDGRAMAEQLTGDAAAYRAVDDLGRDGFDVLGGPGPDPAAG